MNKLWKDRIEVVTWIFGVIGVLVAASIGIMQMRETRLQRAEELRWKQANLGRELVEKMLDADDAASALQMLDWGDQGHEYEIKKGQKVKIDIGDVPHALRLDESHKSDKDVYIRECFDALFFHVNQLERSLRTNVLRFEDVQFPLNYYAEKMLGRKEVFEEYMKKFGDKEALAFFQRYEKWNRTTSN